MLSSTFLEFRDNEIECFDLLVFRPDVFVVAFRLIFQDDTFFIDEGQFFLYNDGSEWKTTGKYCFIKPVETKDYYISKPGSEEPLVGTIRYITDELIAHGLKEGDEIAFTPDSEYEFNVEGEKLYRVNSGNICILL